MSDNKRKKAIKDVETDVDHCMYIDSKKYWEGKEASEIMELINKDGLFFHLRPIEKAFDLRLNQLRMKLHRFLSPEFIEKYDDLDQDIYIQSILVDCRALFLESPRLKENSTLQNIYKIRHQSEKAREIDEVFDEIVVEGKSYRTIIKEVVDKRIVHIDRLDDEQEKKCLDHVDYILSRETIKSLFILLLQISIDYSKFVKQHGESSEEQLNRVLRSLTGGLND